MAGDVRDNVLTNQTQPTVVLNDGVTMPQFGLGVFQTPPETTAQVVGMAVNEGYRAVDTASMYRNEEGVGKALLGRNDVFPRSRRNSAIRITASTKRCALLRIASGSCAATSSISTSSIGRGLGSTTMSKSWKAGSSVSSGSGRVRSIGVSNFNRDHLERIASETGSDVPAVNQIELSSSLSAEGPAKVS